MVCDEDAEAHVAELTNVLLDLVHHEWVGAAKRLVEHDELGVHDEGAGDLEAAALAARERHRFLFPEMSKLDFGEEILQAHGEDVVLNGELAEDAGFLLEVAHAHAGPDIHREM